MRDEKPESEKGVVISMRDAIHIINELRAYDLEREWFEFKVNWYKADELGSIYRHCLTVLHGKENSRVILSGESMM